MSPSSVRARVEFGSRMAAEMGEQPEVLAALAGRTGERVAEIRGLIPASLNGVAFVARGSSDHAALLGRYAVETFTGLPTCLVAPSVTTGAWRPAGRDGWLLVALSQSGDTPEIVTVAQRHREAGATVIAVTNPASSPLSDIAHLTMALGAGPEVAVPATKTVTAQMMTMIQLAGGIAGDGRLTAQLETFAPAVRWVLEDADAVEGVVDVLAQRDRFAVVGRGPSYPAALETALKVQESTGIMAHGFSTADFRHGPVAVCGPHAPAMLLVGSAPAERDTSDLRTLVEHRGAEPIVLGRHPNALAQWPTLTHFGECLLATVRGQQVALSLARRRGVDPDHPPGLSKVTLTH